MESLSEFEQADLDPKTVALLQFYRRLSGKNPLPDSLGGKASHFSQEEERK